MAGLNSQRLEAVFQSRPDILQGIVKAADTPARVKLFNQIAGHVYDQLNGSSEPAHKKRKVDGSAAVANGNGVATGVASTADVEGEDVLLEIKDISVSIPQRKKFDLCFTSKHLYARSPGGGAPVQGMVYAWKDIEYSFYLPVPEKTQPQYNYILMPKGSALLGLSKNAPVGAADPLVFTVPNGAPKPGTIGGSAAAAAENFSDSFSTLFHWSLSANLPQHARLTSANPDKFKSAIRQPHRPKEPAVHVKAFRGSKEGYLFFLDNGILWGYKKPLLFIPLSSVAAVSYCNVLRTTFNMVVEVFAPSSSGGAEGEEENTEEVEFGMLDQTDYPGINESYVMKKGLQDRSMAEQRKAKKELAENERKKGGGDGEDGEMVVDEAEGAAKANGRTILEQAQWEDEQRMQDEEDEDEEDYDPGSEGQSEGSGSDDDDDDDDDDEDEDGPEDGDE